ncbi:MAG: peptidase M23 [Betaproteobacteria bacterium RIFCSPLOWO2_12_FULL_63_13]|nr:MAG: peptidase M23 [Betaproteobacteria bacterium RIFCSPLOWO2_02_FULL_63_19]OGA53461.1 MAG: peptidase M23 [Betaproteobacteria bacterium RIFCSPLOWO2_12_FULL_63_13]
MHIILVSDRLTRSRSFTLTSFHVAAGVVALAATVVVLAGALFYVSVRHAAQIRLPVIESLFLSAQRAEAQEEARKTEGFLRENLNAMAVKVGEMQARLMRLDALGERLSKMAGLKPQEFRFHEVPGRGGAVSTSTPPHDLSLEEFRQQLDDLSTRMENRTDYLGIVESTLFDARVKKKLMPTTTPVDASWNASSFGWRIDPFTGQKALHEGIDFIADVGTPIFAAAGGVVVFARRHPQYGLMVEIDHGNDFVTRYAHASKLFIKVGQVVRRGQKIAVVGSTGRSTGPHLHFEVRYKGVAKNPARFLRASVS